LISAQKVCIFHILERSSSAPQRPAGHPGSGGRLTTGQAAKLFAVTRDAVLKWIKQGRLTAIRTAGGHYRLLEQEVRRLAGAAEGQGGKAGSPRESAPAGAAVMRCWEYAAGEGAPLPPCRHCLAYQAGASFCFQLRRRTSGVPLACCGPAECADCPYYRRVHGLPGRLLLVGSAAVLSPGLRKSKQWKVLRAEDAYQAGQLVLRYFPAVAVVDAATGKQGRQFIERLLEDPQAIRTRIVFVGAGRRPRRFVSGAEPGVWSRVSLAIGPLSRQALESVLPPVPAPGPREVL